VYEIHLILHELLWTIMKLGPGTDLLKHLSTT